MMTTDECDVFFESWAQQILADADIQREDAAEVIDSLRSHRHLIILRPAEFYSDEQPDPDDDEYALMSLVMPGLVLESHDDIDMLIILCEQIGASVDFHLYPNVPQFGYCRRH